MKDANPYEPIPLDATLGLNGEAPESRDSPVRMFLLSVALGTAIALLLFAVCFVLGAHGGLPATGFYILGPSIWICLLDISELPFLFALGSAMCVQWAAYWWFAMVGSSQHLASRLLAILLIHVASVACYQFTVGLP